MYMGVLPACISDLCTTYMPGASRGQKGALDVLELESQAVVMCWELSLGPLEEHSMLLTAKPSLHPIWQQCLEPFS